MLSLRRLSTEPIFQSRQLSIRGIGVHEVMPPCFIERPKGTGDYLFMLFHDAVECGCPPAKLQFAPSTLMLWGPGMPQYYGSVRSRWSHSWIHCDGAAISAILRQSRLTTGAHVRVKDPSPIDRYLFELHAEVTGPHVSDAVIVRNLLDNLLREVARAQTPPRRLPVPPNITASKAFIDAHYETPATLTDLAKLAGLSPRHFCTEFARHYGVSPVAYLIHCRLQAAATLVRGTSHPIGEIGRRVGYDDPYYFSKHFKAYFGVPPTRLR